MITIYKSCSKCGKIHDINYRCYANYKYEARKDNETRKIRNCYSWHKKAEEIKKESKYICAVCFDEGIINYNNLEVHHIEKLRHNTERLLDDDNLICLCTKHHHQADTGKIKKDYLDELVKKRKNNSLVN